MITPENKAAWLAERSSYIGASEVAAVIGASPWQTPVEKWQEKTGRIGTTEGNEAMEWGLLLEPLILAEYERRQGVTVERRQEFSRHPIYPFMGATLDGVTGSKLVEVKTTSAFAKDFGDEDDDAIPDHYRVQVHAQMAVTGLAQADLVVLIGGQRLKIYPVERHDPLVNLIEDRCSEFWECVQSDTPPTWGKMTPQSLAVINPECEGVAEWDEVTAAVIAEHIEKIEQNKETVKRLEEDIESYKSSVLQLLGNARTGYLPDGRRVNRYLERHEAKTVSYVTKPSVRHYFKVGKAK
jgi:putative phage-type endonuclease